MDIKLTGSEVYKILELHFKTLEKPFFILSFSCSEPTREGQQKPPLSRSVTIYGNSDRVAQIEYYGQ